MKGGLGRDTKCRKGHRTVPCGRHDIPARGNQSPPLTGRKEHSHIDESVDHPHQNRQEMPAPSGAEIVMTTRQRDNRIDRFGLVHRRPEPILRHDFFAEFDPFTSRSCIVVPVQFGVIGQNLNAAPDQEEHAKQVDEVRRAKPEWKARIIHTTSSLKRIAKSSSSCFASDGPTLASERPTYNRHPTSQVPFALRTFAQAAQISPHDNRITHHAS